MSRAQKYRCEFVFFSVFLVYIKKMRIFAAVLVMTGCSTPA